MKKKILMISFRCPGPEYKGGYILRLLNIAKILAKYYQVYLLTLIEKEEEKKYLKNLKRIFNKVIYFYHPKSFEYFGAFQSLFSSKPLEVGYYYSSKMISWIKRNYKEYDLIFCSTIRTAEYAKNLQIKKCIDFIDAISLNYWQALKFSKGFWKLIYIIENKRLKNYERKTLENFDLAFIASERDKNFILKGTKGNKKIIVLPNGVREELFKRNFKGKDENWLSFFGKMNYQPNEDACIFFAKKIFPRIKEKFSNLKFFIIGADPTQKILNLRKISGIEVTGFLKDPYFYLERSKIVIAPLRFGSGIQNKILEAMALGKAVLTTPLGAAGISKAKDQEHLIIADWKKPKKMAKEVIRLLKDDEFRRKIGKAAKKLISENYTWDRVEKKLFKSLSSIL